jgi:hypothetical protein
MLVRIGLLAFFILGSYFCSGQSEKEKISHGGFGITVIPFGKNNVYAGPEDEVEGRAVYTYSKKPFYSGYLYGFYNIKKNTRFVIGLGCSWNEIYGSEYYDRKYYYYHDHIKVYTIPVYIEKTLFNYIFITYGGIVHFEDNFLEDDNPSTVSRVDKQRGVGLITSLGGTYHFKSGITVFAGPSLFIYSIFGSQFIFSDRVAGIGAGFGMSVDL